MIDLPSLAHFPDKIHHMELAIIAAILFLGAFTQALSGFGSALVAMALLPGFLDRQIATPMVALSGLLIDFSLLCIYRESFNLKAVWRMTAASILTIPIGVWALRGVSEDFFMTLLGILIAGYALYGLFQFRMPELRHPLWGIFAGLLAGMLGGAYNTSGPPAIVYGHCRRWAPAEFKSNLQGFFVLNSALVVAGHALSHNLTQPVWNGFLWALPAMGLGILLGSRMDRFVKPDTFRTLVLLLLVFMGVRLIIM